MASAENDDVVLEEECEDPSSEETPDRVVVLFGRTGVGKSTVASVLAGRPGCYAESSGIASQTKGIKSRLFRVRLRGETYVLKIIDTMGLGDTGLENNDVDVVRQLVHLVRECSGGIHQVMFVTEGRFTEVQHQCFKLLQRVLFTEDVLGYTCVVRTFCDKFEEAEEEARVRTSLCEQSDLMEKIKHFILVNCPPTEREKTRELYREDRRLSRCKLLEHLIDNCKEVFKPGHLQEASERIEKYDEEGWRLQMQRKELEKQYEELKESTAKREEEVNALHLKHKHAIASIMDQLKTVHEESDAERRSLEKRLEEAKDEQHNRQGRAREAAQEHSLTIQEMKSKCEQLRVEVEEVGRKSKVEFESRLKEAIRADEDSYRQAIRSMSWLRRLWYATK
ncbi:GTPase IMAP family member 4-like [Sycon ciliatum]|uniref:GTPase IMAP family member 4-like n=1 Tax=Sycon ciliatum TaxID=27933 RepID=UPI0031F5FD62